MQDKNETFSHSEMILKEDGMALQRGMNFRPPKKKYSILLMSKLEKSPYNDGVNEHNILVYEGEDLSRREHDGPKQFDQPFFTKTGKLTSNGKFFEAAEAYKLKRRKIAEKVKIYEKLAVNVWTDKGFYRLIDVEYTKSNHEDRKVFTFYLISDDVHVEDEEVALLSFSRNIPSHVRSVVWERDQGACQACGATEDLHYDHILPYSKGGSSRTAKNVQLLCVTCNLKKSNKIV